MDAAILKAFDESLVRCQAEASFLDRFYEIFLASSPMVKAKFSNTDFVHQKRALRMSLHAMALAAEDEAAGPAKYLASYAEQHGSRGLNIGAEYYDLWLDSLLQTVRETDPECTPEILAAWERVMMVGIGYLLSRY